MIETLMEHVAGLPEDRLGALLIQEAALCQTWWAGCMGNTFEQARWQALPQQVRAWQRRARLPEEKTEGRRHQWVLRELIGLLGQDPRHHLNGEEAFFLKTALMLAKSSPLAHRYERLIELISAHGSYLEERCKDRGPAGGLPSLARRIQYITEELLPGAPHRETRLLAGIELPASGPVFSCSGHLRILGDVPERCTVVVEGAGMCSVDGYVLGRVLAKEHCEVRGNIAGAVIVLQGDIRARGIINNAYVVAKRGGVYCVNAQGPRLVFASKEIMLESAKMGRYVTRVLEVIKDLSGGQVHVSELARAGCWRNLGPNDLRVVLRRELCCEDYGEVSGEELNRLLSEAYRFRTMARNLEVMAEMARRESEHNAQSALMYLFGGGEMHKKLVDIAGAQRRIHAIDRLNHSLQVLLVSAQDGLMRKQEEIAVPDSEVMELEGDRLIENELAKETEEGAAMSAALSTRSISPVQASRTIADIGKKLKQLGRERAVQEKMIAQREKEMQSLGQYEALLKGAGNSTTKLELLLKILPGLKKQPPESPVVTRLGSPFVIMALRNIDRQMRNQKEYKQHAEEYRQGFRAVSERLGKDFQIHVLENPDEEERSAKVTGRFEKGVKIYMDMYAENELELLPESLIRTPGGNEVRTYVRGIHVSRFHVRG